LAGFGAVDLKDLADLVEADFFDFVDLVVTGNLFLRVVSTGIEDSGEGERVVSAKPTTNKGKPVAGRSAEYQQRAVLFPGTG
jgi:hypothetical protein